MTEYDSGGYAVQGLGAAFIARMEGSVSDVMVLPVFETVPLLLHITVGVLA